MAIHRKVRMPSVLFLVVCCSSWLSVQGSVLVPTYALPPSSFMKSVRDQRSLPATRTLARLAGGHLKLHTLQDNNNSNKDSEKGADYGKNTYGFVDKDTKGHEDKFAGIVVKTEKNVGWNQGQWDDGMLMSSAGNGKEKGKQKTEKYEDDDKKTLADQVAEGKYGLIQKELFVKAPTRPGVVSYESNPETETKDNHETLGGLKKDDIWLAEDHLLVLKGGSFPDHGLKPGTDGEAWPAIDNYQAPPRQVKIPANPEVPPPFPVRLSDDGPLVFLTPNGSIPAPLLPSEPPREGYGTLPFETFPYPPPNTFPPKSINQRNATSGRAALPNVAFPFISGKVGAGPFPFPDSLNDGSQPSLPPGAVFLPPPPINANLSDLYDEDDPSIYYPPPYNFSYKPENTSKVPPGPLVPGIVLPPPPDFFAPLNSPNPTTTTRPTAHVYPPTSGAPPTAILRSRPPLSPVYLPAKPVPTVSDSPDNSIDIVTTPPTKSIIYSRPVQKKPSKVVIIPKPIPHRKPYSTALPITTTNLARQSNKTVEKKRPSVTIIQKPLKTTLKPVSGPLYEYTDKNNYLEGNSVSPSPQPFIVYGPPDGAIQDEKQLVTSTPIPLTGYYSDPKYENILSQIQFAKQNTPNTRITPEFYSPKQNGKSVASFYFYEEPVTKIAVTTPVPQTYYEDSNYYQSLSDNRPNIQDNYFYNSDAQRGFIPSTNLEYRPIPSREPSPFFFVPQRQGSRTLTQEYFSINQNVKPQTNTILNANYIKQQPLQQTIQAQPVRSNNFYDQIASIQQTIDYFTTHRPNANNYPSVYREIRQKAKPTPRPVYQFSYQNNNLRQEHNSFRAPKMDPEPFRPMVAYSKPYKVESDYTTTPETLTVENQVVTELPQPSKYYTTAKPEDYDYVDQPQRQTDDRETNKPLVIAQSPIIKKPKRIHSFGPTTANPVHHAYYTKNEESLFDDITKNYFTIFGQKIENENRDNQGIAVTTPLRPVEISTVKAPINNNINIQYDDETNTNKPNIKPISLEGDTDVNYRQPRPIINPESEFIPIVNPEIQAKYQAEKQLQQLREEYYHKTQNVQVIKSEPIKQPLGHPQYTGEQLDYYRGPNYGNQQFQTAQRGISNNYNARPHVAEGRPGSLVAYRLPGEGAHVYFLTPQPARTDNFKYRSAEEIAALS